MQLVECVPNISEGRRPEVYQAVAQAAASVEGVTLLDIDPGKETNRTVITFAGPPEAVMEGAFQLVREALERIDMRNHRGAHARLGAVDVVPFVPVEGVDLDFCAELARKLGQRVGEELGIPVYLYEHAASRPERRNLADIRAGEYEGLAAKLQDPNWQPDFGPAVFLPKSGAVVIGARNFLVAYNVNLNTTDARLATRVAGEIREKGRRRLDLSGKPVVDAEGREIWDPGLLPGVKAVGWTIPEFGCAQISINITDLNRSPLHHVFDVCEERARAHGLRVTGSELVGLIPERALLEAGRHYLRRMGRCAGASRRRLVAVAARTLGLSEVKPFVAEDRILEWRLKPEPKLARLSVADFLEELSSDSPAPGGGSVAALVGALGAALTSMVAHLTYSKRGYEERQSRLEQIASEATAIWERLLAAIDEDTRAFERYLQVRKLPQGTEAEKQRRQRELDAAVAAVIEVPLGVLEACPAVARLASSMLEIGFPASRTDAGTGLACARAAASGAYQNVLVNLELVEDKAQRQTWFLRAREAFEQTDRQVQEAERRWIAALEAAVCG